MLFFLSISYSYIGDIMLERLYNYVSDNEFRLTIYQDKINIINFKKIISLEEDYVSFLSPTQKIIITGNHFILNKLLKDELLVTGKVKKIEITNE